MSYPGSSPLPPWAASDADDELGAIADAADDRPGVSSALAGAHAQAGLEAQRDACEGPDGGGAVLACINVCALHRLPLPDWLADAFVRRYQLVSGAWAKSWDDPNAFGRPWPKRARLAQIRQDTRLKLRVHAEVWRMVQQDLDCPIRRTTFDAVGALPGIGKDGAAVEKLYYRALADGKVNVSDWRNAIRGGALPAPAPTYKQAQEQDAGGILRGARHDGSPLDLARPCRATPWGRGKVCTSAVGDRT